MIFIKALEDKIINEGKVLPGNILKVSNFLNHQIDVSFMMEMGKEIAHLYENCGVNKILTIESSGIAIAICTANYMNVPVVFAKKHKSSNISNNVFSSKVKSFTHKTTYDVCVDNEFLNKDDKILIVDDFLANGNALIGLMEIIQKAGGEVLGAAIAIEKGFQHGGDNLRAKGLRVESLAIIDEMTENSLTFRK